MAVTLGEMVYKITGDASGFNKSIGETEQSLKKTTSVFASMSTGAKIALAAVGVAVIGVTKKIIGLASDAAETEQKFGVVFSGIRESADAMAQALARDFGISKQASQDMLSTTGNVLQSVGYTQEASLQMSDTVARLASDLVSFSNSNLSAKEAADVLTKGLLGEREALGSLGFKITENELKAYIEAQGKAYESATAQEKAEATLNIMLEKNRNAIGDYARSWDSVANLSRAIGNRFDDIGAAIGTEMLPGLSDLGQAFLLATEDGGVLLDLFKSLAKGASTLASNVAALIGYFDMLNKSVKADSAHKSAMQLWADVKLLNREQKATEAQLKNMSWTDAAYGATQQKLKDIIAEKARVTKEAEKATKASQNLSEDAIFTGEKAVEALEGEAAAIKKKAEERRRANRDLPPPKTGGGGATAEHDLFAAGEDFTPTLLEWDMLWVQITRDADNAWQAMTPADKMKSIISTVGEFGQAVTNILGALGGLYAAQNEAALNSLEVQRQAALEAAGVAEETALEKAQKELDIAKEKGDAQTIKEKEDAVKRAKINEEYDKKKRKLEYEGSLAAWEIQRAQAAISVAMAPLQAYAAVVGTPLIGPYIAPVLAAAAAVTAGIGYQAVMAAKPQAPKFEAGGIVPGSLTSGDRVNARVNSGEMILNKEQQSRLFDMANGGAGGGQPIYLTVQVGAEKLYETLFNATKRGELLISSGAVVAR